MPDKTLSKSSVTDDSLTSEVGHDPLRRSMLAAIGGALALAGCSTRIKADTETEAKKAEVFNAYDRMREFDGNQMDSGKPWVASKTGNFDLTDPIDNRLARLKMTNNLVGARTYIPMIVRLMIARDNEPGGVLMGGAGMFTWQLQEPDPKEFPDLPEGSAILRSMFTARYLDPETMEPVDTLLNPYNGKMMKLEPLFFAENFINYPKGGSRFVEEPQFADDDPNEPNMSLIKRWGDDLVLFTGGTYSEPGLHQPRFTENNWTCDYDDVMNPDKDKIKTRYAFAGINRAFEKPWAGYTMDDKDMLMDLAIGKKVHSADDLPDFHKRVIAEPFPNRL